MSKGNEFVLEIEEGVQHQPERLLVYGPPGIGKSTFAANAPKPFFFDLERGSTRLNVARNRKPIEDWEGLLAGLRYFADNATPYETIVVDTLDRAEWLCWQFLCKTGGKNGAPVKSIEEVGGGFQKGYTAAYEEFRKFFGLLEDVWRKQGKRVIILAHAKLENVKNPAGPDYQRYSLKVDPRVAGMFYEVVDAALFARTDVIVTKEVHDKKRVRAIGGDARIAYTQESPTHVAKNRYGLPVEIDFSWDSFVTHVAAGHSPRLLIDTIHDRLRLLADEQLTKTVKAHLAKIGEDTKKLIEVNGRLLNRLTEKTKAALESESGDGATATQEANTTTTN